ncbi:DsbE family thiol:disulfide interchange protein [Chelatococcus reniformis]|uniref:Thiol:disulfide interchange protein CycY n=1 Tax=Chelatococcus reniformis TaxID=1494448 RepID=A0A916X891_9HYPH|nr:DsbE family thiol:disulfide interchange protein [Chelatococcus reniformis]GGC51052.1 thiol:disulfide interchange protein CycY [Chelatococcus reniformis]
MSDNPQVDPSAPVEGPTAGPRRRLVLIPLLVFLALAALLLVRLFGGGDPSAVPSALIGKPVPSFDLPPLPGLGQDGAAVPGLKAADLKGHVTVVNVWASWCAPCRIEHPLLLQLARDPRIRLVGINYKDTPENARRFLGQLGNPFAAVGQDLSGRTGIDWGVYGVPETFVVDASGIIRHKHVGPLTPQSLSTTVAAAIGAAQDPQPR